MGQEYLRRHIAQPDINHLSDTLIIDTFEDTLFRWIIGGDAGSVVERTEAVAYTGSASMVIKTKPTTPVAADYAYAERYTCMRVGKTLELSCMIYTPAPDDIDEIRLEIDVADGTYINTVMIRLHKPTMSIQFYNQVGAMEDVPNSTFKHFAQRWSLLVMKINTLDKLITNIFFQNVNLNNLKLTYSSTSQTTLYHQYVQVYVGKDATATQGILYVDNVLLRQVEP